MGKLVYESLFEFISHDEDAWADTQLDRWEMEKKGQNPLEKYVEEVAKIIFNSMDEDDIKNTGITQYIIEDLITDDNLFETNAYTFYDQSKPAATAAFELGLSVDNYIMEMGGRE